MSREHESTTMNDDGDSTDSFDLSNPGRVQLGVTRGEYDLEIGGPREHPDRADIAVRPADDGRLLVTVDAMAGDHATGHADVALTLEDARALQEMLEETIRWMSDETETGQ